MKPDPDPGAILPVRESTRYRLPENPEDILPIVPAQVETPVVPVLPDREPSLASLAAAWDAPEPTVEVKVPTFDVTLGEQ